jgi:hypothetical protein
MKRKKTVSATTSAMEPVKKISVGRLSQRMREGWQRKARSERCQVFPCLALLAQAGQGGHRARERGLAANSPVALFVPRAQKQIKTGSFHSEISSPASFIL